MSIGRPLLRVATLAGVNLLVLAAGALALELLFGSWFDEHSYGRLNVLRNVSRVMDVNELYPSAEPVVYRRDHHGLRGAYPDPSNIDVLTVGGSTTNEFYITEGRTWTAILQRELAAAGHELAVVNAGIDGQSTRGHLYNFEAWFPNIPNLKPRYVLAYIGFNDLKVGAQPSRFDRILEKKPSHRALRYVKNHSALYRAFLVLKGWHEARSHKLVHGTAPRASGPWVPATGRSPPGTQWARELAAYAERIRALASRIEAMGATPIFMTQPAGTFRLDGGVLLGRQQADGRLEVGPYFKLMAFNETLLATCQQEGYVCFDASTIEFADGDFYDHVHTTPAGSEKIGRFAAAQYLERVLLVEEGRGK